MTRHVAVAVVVLALLFGSVGTAHAQDDPAAPTGSPTPTVVEPSTSTTPTAEPTPSPSSTPTTTPPSTTPTTTATPPPRSSTAATPSSTRPPAATSTSPRPTGTGAGAAAVPGPTSTPPPSTTSTTTSPRYSALAPWIPANDHPEIGLIAIILMIVGGVGFGVVLEHGPGRRNRRA